MILNIIKASVFLSVFLCSFAFAQSSSVPPARRGQFSGDQLLNVAALDEMPSKGFRAFWKKVGDENGFNLMRQKPNALSVMESVSLGGDWTRWAEFSDASRFYLAGLVVHVKSEGQQVKFSEEDFKSHVIGAIQCTNAMYNSLKPFKNRAEGTVEQFLSLCGTHRTMLID